jgi:hypothetical protein
MIIVSIKKVSIIFLSIHKVNEHCTDVESAEHQGGPKGIFHLYLGVNLTIRSP